MKYILSIILFALSLPALAVDYHVCDCLTGAHASCVAGANANAGTSSSAPKQTLAGYNYSSLLAGDRVLACQGGSMTSASIQLENANATRASPITFDSYVPSTGATGTPIFRASGTSDFFILGGFFATTNTGHWVFRNLYFDGLNTGGDAITAFRVASLLLENVTFTRWAHGIELGQTQDLGRNTDFTLRNSTVSRNYITGLIGGANGLLIENTLFSKNARSEPVEDRGFHHNIYMSNADRVLIRRNTFIDPGNADTDGTVCTQGNFTFRGITDELVFENNTITNTSVTSTCGGITLAAGYSSAEVMNDAVIRGNRLRNAVVRIACAPRFLVENNSFVWTVEPLQGAFTVPVSMCSTNPGPDTPDTGGTVRNNSMLFDVALANGTTGFNMIGSGTDGIGTNFRFTGNIVYFANTSGAGARTCFAYSALANYTFVDRNQCFQFNNWSTAHSTLAIAQAAGYDTNGLNSNPSFAATPAVGNNWSMKLGAGSPSLAAGSVTHAPRRSIDGWTRPANPSIGAFDANNP